MMKLEKGHKALRKGRVSESGYCYSLTFITNKRKLVFSNPMSATLMSRILNREVILKDTNLLAWVVIPDHIHLLIQLGTQQSLGMFVRGIKNDKYQRNLTRYKALG